MNEALVDKSHAGTLFKNAVRAFQYTNFNRNLRGVLEKGVKIVFLKVPQNVCHMTRYVNNARLVHMTRFIYIRAFGKYMPLGVLEFCNW